MKQRIVLGIAVLALVAVAGLAGTRAFFSDTESSQGNVFAAGAIDLKVDHNRATYNGEDCEATCDTWAQAVEDFDQGDRNDGGAVASDRSNSSEALGPADTSGNNTDTNPTGFVSLGFGGSIVLHFPDGIDDGPGDDIRIYEATGDTTPAYDDESVSVEVSPDGSDWTTIDVTPSDITFDGTIEIDLNGASTARYVRLTDTTDPADHDGAADGYDLDAVEAIHCDNEETDGVASDAWQCELWGEKDLENERFFDFSDIKPGDTGSNSISLHVDNNDSYMCLATENTENNDNGLTDPESDVDSTGGDGEGELGANLMFFAWNDTNGDGEFDSGEDQLAGPTVADDLDLITFADSNSGAFPGGTTDYLGVEWCAGEMTLNDGVIECDGSEMGNESQTDSFHADLQFHAIQSRNNDDFTCAGYFGEGDRDGSIGCSDEADVMLVMDSSGSISDSEMESMKDDAKSFIATLGPTEDGVNIGVVDFDRDGTVEEGLTHVVADLESAINGMNDGGTTNMTQGINVAQTELEDNGRPDAPNFMIVITDGEPNDGTAAGNEAENARNANTTIYAIGVGSGADDDYLKDNIVSSEPEDHYFDATNFDEVESQFDQLLTCEPQPELLID